MSETGMSVAKRDHLAELVAQARSFRFCGPSDDPDEQTAVTTGYQYLLVQLQRLSTPLLPQAESSRLNAIEIDVHDIYTVYKAHAEVDALLPDIETALEGAHEDALSLGANAWIVERGLLDQLTSLQPKLDARVLVRICQEINSCWAHGNVIATALLMRAVLNYVPPVFGRETFSQVVANCDRTLKQSLTHLEEGLRKIADFHTHRRIGPADCPPSSAQVEPFKPQFELLLQEVVSRVNAG
jgi:hypothetical protein